jgi:hypothetical protein
MQAENVSKAPAGGGVAREETLAAPPEDVEEAGRILAKHFDPDELYWAMIDEVRKRA